MNTKVIIATILGLAIISSAIVASRKNTESILDEEEMINDTDTEIIEEVEDTKLEPLTTQSDPFPEVVTQAKSVTKPLTIKPDLPREYEENFRTHFPEFGEAVIAGDCSAVDTYYRKSCDYYLSVYSRKLMPLITPDDLSESALYFPDVKNTIVYGKSTCEEASQKMIASYGYSNDETIAFEEVVDFCYQLSALINADISICEKSSSEDSRIYCEEEVRRKAGHFFGPEHPIFMGIYDDYL